jgi:hypothetical protein
MPGSLEVPVGDVLASHLRGAGEQQVLQVDPLISRFVGRDPKKATKELPHDRAPIFVNDLSHLPGEHRRVVLNLAGMRDCAPPLVRDAVIGLGRRIGAMKGKLVLAAANGLLEAVQTSGLPEGTVVVKSTLSEALAEFRK